MGTITREVGRTIKCMVKARRNGLTVPHMKGSSPMARRMVKVDS
jgi:hypothetical protein